MLRGSTVMNPRLGFDPASNFRESDRSHRPQTTALAFHSVVTATRATPLNPKTVAAAGVTSMIRPRT
jgi:hypothetical protein